MKKEIQTLEQRRESLIRKGGELAQQKSEKQRQYQGYQQDATMEMSKDGLQLLTPYIERYSLQDNVAFKPNQGASLIKAKQSSKLVNDLK